MKFEIELQKHETYNCFDENIVSIICQCYRKDIGIYFLNDFGFSKSATYDINNKFKISTSCGMSKTLLENFLKIRIEYFRKESFSCDGFRDLLLREIKNKGLFGISLDAYYCPWNKSYFGVVHMQHYSMIIHADEDRCVCVDPYFNLEQQVISVRGLYDIIEGMLIFNIGEQKIDYTMVGQLCRRELINQKSKRKKEISKFAELISSQNVEEIHQSVNGDINACGLVFSINSIHKARCNYRDSLYLYGNKIGFDSDIAEKISVLCQKLEKVQGLCIMAIYRKKDKCLSVAFDALYDSAEKEEEIIDCICS